MWVLHDVGNLTRYVESRWEFDMTWQVVDLAAAVTSLADSVARLVLIAEELNDERRSDDV